MKFFKKIYKLAGLNKFGWLRFIAYKILWLISPRTIRIVRAEGNHKIAIVPHDRGTGFPLWIGHRLEKGTADLLKRIVKEGEIAFDVGANAGYFTFLLSSLVGESGRVVAFEPVGAHVELLSKTVELNGLRNVAICECAVSDRDGEVELTTDRHNFGLASLSAKNVSAKHSTVRVRGLTLDSFSELEGVFPSFLKIDVQGAEAKVLRGAKSHLSKDIQIVFEYWPRGISNLGDNPADLFNILMDHGFSLHRIGDNSELVEINQMGFAELTYELLAAKNPLYSINLLANKE